MNEQNISGRDLFLLVVLDISTFAKQLFFLEYAGDLHVIALRVKAMNIAWNNNWID